MKQKFPTTRVMFWAVLAISASVVQSVGFIDGDHAAMAQGGDVYVPSDDAAIEQSRVDAQSELPTFLKIAKSDPEHWEAMSVKVALPTDDASEHIWISEFTRINGTRYEGILSNDPVNLPDLKAGDCVEFTYDQIDDFGFIEGGQGYGFYSVRAILPLMSEQQAASYGGFLSPDLLPSYW